MCWKYDPYLGDGCPVETALDEEMEMPGQVHSELREIEVLVSVFGVWLLHASMGLDLELPTTRNLCLFIRKTSQPKQLDAPFVCFNGLCRQKKVCNGLPKALMVCRGYGLILDLRLLGLKKLVRLKNWSMPVPHVESKQLSTCSEDSTFAIRALG